MAGASIKEIQEEAGHKTITMAARYSYLSPEHRQSVVGAGRRSGHSVNQHAPEHAPGKYGYSAMSGYSPVSL